MPGPCVPVHEHAGGGEEKGKRPSGCHRPVQRNIADAIVDAEGSKRVQSDEKDKHCAANVARVKQPSLEKAREGGCQDGVDTKPVQSNGHCRALQKVGKQEVGEQDDVLAGGGLSPMLSLPWILRQQIGEHEAEEAEREQREQGQRYEAVPQRARQSGDGH